MSEPIDLPSELQHLIEKRENEQDRRKQDTGPPAERELDQNHETNAESAAGAERRKNNRREADQE